MLLSDDRFDGQSWIDTFVYRHIIRYDEFRIRDLQTIYSEKESWKSSENLK